MKPKIASAVVAGAVLVAACGGSDDEPGLPQLGQATGVSLGACAALGTFSYANTTVTSATAVPAGTLIDMLTPLVNWVEKGQAPDSVIATARGPGNAGGVNGDVPAAWAASRTRPLCPYPEIARYDTTGSLEDAGSFTCQ